MRRVAVCFDGFNYYYGLRKLRQITGKCYYWHDIREIASWLVAERQGADPSDRLERVAYFTADIKSPDHRKRWRQQNYFNLLQASSLVELVKGEYVIRPHRCSVCEAEPPVCKQCESKLEKHQEKQTDVNLALWAIIAAYKDLYDDLIVVTSDMDLAKVAFQVRRQFPDKRAYFAFPPMQIENEALKAEASGCLSVTEAMLLESMFRQRLKVGGVTFGCPREWIQGDVLPR